MVSCQVLHWLMVTSLSPEAPAAKCSSHTPPSSPCRAPVSLLSSPQHEKACGMRDLVPQTLPPWPLLCPSSGPQALATRVPTKQVPTFTDPTLCAQLASLSPSPTHQESSRQGAGPVKTPHHLLPLSSHSPQESSAFFRAHLQPPLLIPHFCWHSAYGQASGLSLVVPQ